MSPLFFRFLSSRLSGRRLSARMPEVAASLQIIILALRDIILLPVLSLLCYNPAHHLAAPALVASSRHFVVRSLEVLFAVRPDQLQPIDQGGRDMAYIDDLHIPLITERLQASLVSPSAVLL